MTEGQLQEFERLAAAATPGPWAWHRDCLHATSLVWTQEYIEDDDASWHGRWMNGEPGPRIIETDSHVYGPCAPDAAFIAAARAAVPALVAEVRRLRALVQAAFEEGRTQFSDAEDSWDRSDAKRALDGGAVT